MIRFGSPVVAASPLAAALDGVIRVEGGWAEITIARQPFRFLIGTPLYQFSNQLQPLAASASLAADTLFLPYQFVAEIIPVLPGRPLSLGCAPGQAGGVSGPDHARWPAGRLPTPPACPTVSGPGTSSRSIPGMAASIPGIPGTYFPRGIREKDVTLQVSLLLRDELKRRGIGVRMTRTTDTLIALGDRGGYCTAECDLFVSLHVNSLARRRGYTDVRGFETFFLAEAKTEDAARVAKMENDAVRFETGEDPAAVVGGLDFILKDLQLNEHLRESARLAELVRARARGGAHR